MSFVQDSSGSGRNLVLQNAPATSLSHHIAAVPAANNGNTITITGIGARDNGNSFRVFAWVSTVENYDTSTITYDDTRFDGGKGSVTTHSTPTLTSSAPLARTAENALLNLQGGPYYAYALVVDRAGLRFAPPWRSSTAIYTDTNAPVLSAGAPSVTSQFFQLTVGSFTATEDHRPPFSVHVYASTSSTLVPSSLLSATVGAGSTVGIVSTHRTTAGTLTVPSCVLQKVFSTADGATVDMLNHAKYYVIVYTVDSLQNRAIRTAILASTSNDTTVPVLTGTPIATASGGNTITVTGITASDNSEHFKILVWVSKSDAFETTFNYVDAPPNGWSQTYTPGTSATGVSSTGITHTAISESLADSSGPYYAYVLIVDRANNLLGERWSWRSDALYTDDMAPTIVGTAPTFTPTINSIGYPTFQTTEPFHRPFWTFVYATVSTSSDILPPSNNIIPAGAGVAITSSTTTLTVPAGTLTHFYNAQGVVTLMALDTTYTVFVYTRDNRGNAAARIRENVTTLKDTQAPAVDGTFTVAHKDKWYSLTFNAFTVIEPYSTSYSVHVYAATSATLVPQIVLNATIGSGSVGNGVVTTHTTSSVAAADLTMAFSSVDGAPVDMAHNTSYHVIVYTVDSLGNRGIQVAEQATTRSDTVDPTLTGTPTVTTTGSSITITGINASDNSGWYRAFAWISTLSQYADTFTYASSSPTNVWTELNPVGAKSSSARTTTIDGTPISDGTYYAYVLVIDRAGRRVPWVSSGIIVDSSAPTIKGSAPTIGKTANSITYTLFETEESLSLPFSTYVYAATTTTYVPTAIVNNGITGAFPAGAGAAVHSTGTNTTLSIPAGTVTSFYNASNNAVSAMIPNTTYYLIVSTRDARNNQAFRVQETITTSPDTEAPVAILPSRFLRTGYDSLETESFTVTDATPGTNTTIVIFSSNANLALSTMESTFNPDTRAGGKSTSNSFPLLFNRTHVYSTDLTILIKMVSGATYYAYVVTYDSVANTNRANPYKRSINIPKVTTFVAPESAATSFNCLYQVTCPTNYTAYLIAQKNSLNDPIQGAGATSTRSASTDSIPQNIGPISQAWDTTAQTKENFIIGTTYTMHLYVRTTGVEYGEWWSSWPGLVTAGNTRVSYIAANSNAPLLTNTSISVSVTDSSLTVNGIGASDDTGRFVIIAWASTINTYNSDAFEYSSTYYSGLGLTVYRTICTSNQTSVSSGGITNIITGSPVVPSGGPYYAYVRVIDETNNRSSVYVSDALYADGTNPVISTNPTLTIGNQSFEVSAFTGYDNSGIFKAFVFASEITVPAFDVDANITYTTNATNRPGAIILTGTSTTGQSFAAQTLTKDIGNTTLVRSKAYHVHVVLVDRSNRRAKFVSSTVYPDNIAPTLSSITAEGAEGRVRLTAAITSSDDSGIVNVYAFATLSSNTNPTLVTGSSRVWKKLNHNGTGDLTPFEFSHTMDDSAITNANSYYVWVQAIDQAGNNVRRQSAAITPTSNNAAPTIGTFTVTPTSSAIGFSTFTVADASPPFAVFVYASINESTQNPYLTTLVQDGTVNNTYKHRVESATSGTVPAGSVSMVYNFTNSTWASMAASTKYKLHVVTVDRYSNRELRWNTEYTTLGTDSTAPVVVLGTNPYVTQAYDPSNYGTIKIQNITASDAGGASVRFKIFAWISNNSTFDASVITYATTFPIVNGAPNGYTAEFTANIDANSPVNTGEFVKTYENANIMKGNKLYAYVMAIDSLGNRSAVINSGELYPYSGAPTLTTTNITGTGTTTTGTPAVRSITVSGIQAYDIIPYKIFVWISTTKSSFLAHPDDTTLTYSTQSRSDFTLSVLGPFKGEEIGQSSSALTELLNGTTLASTGFYFAYARVVNFNNVRSTSWSSEVIRTNTDALGTLTSNDLSGARAVYGMRRVVPGYTGPTIQVRRQDGILAEVYINRDGTVEGIVTSDLPYIGSTSFKTWLEEIALVAPHVTKWYDQTTYKKHVSPVFADRRPSTTVDLQGISFSTNTHLLTASTGPLDNGDTSYAYFVLHKPSDLTNPALQVVMEHNASTSTTGKRASIFSDNGRWAFIGENADAFNLITNTNTTVNHKTWLKVNGQTVQMRINDVTSSSATVSTTLSLSNARFGFGTKISTNDEFYKGTIYEAIVFDTVTTTTQDVNVFNSWSLHTLAFNSQTVSQTASNIVLYGPASFGVYFTVSSTSTYTAILALYNDSAHITRSSPLSSTTKTSVYSNVSGQQPIFVSHATATTGTIIYWKLSITGIDVNPSFLTGFYMTPTYTSPG